MSDHLAFTTIGRRHSRLYRVNCPRGVASLVVVMLLFFVVALVAAYTSRNMLFEQRTGVNQLRSTQALEAAQAGLEWAVGMLNAGRIGDDCAISLDATKSTFRQRYLNLDGPAPVSVGIAPGNGTGLVTPKLRSNGLQLMPGCVATATAWSCSCPVDDAPLLTSSTGAVLPAFRVRFLDEPNGVIGLVKIEVNGCTKLDDGCLNFPATATSGEGRATVFALLALRSAVVTPPVAAITGRSTLTGSVRAVNTDVSAGGIAAQSGAAVAVDTSKLQGPPGTPIQLAIIENDTALSAAKLPADPWPLGDRMFASVFGMWPRVYVEQPAAVVLDCGLVACVSATVRDVANLNPGRVIWVKGNLSVNDAGAIGSADEPVVLVVEGNLAFASDATIFGLVYGGRSPVVPLVPWAISGTGTIPAAPGLSHIRGALVAEHAAAAATDPVVIFDKAILNRLRLTSGTFVMVPGSWRDFP